MAFCLYLAKLVPHCAHFAPPKNWCHTAHTSHPPPPLLTMPRGYTKCPRCDCPHGSNADECPSCGLPKAVRVGGASLHKLNTKPVSKAVSRAAFKSISKFGTPTKKTQVKVPAKTPTKTPSKKALTKSPTKTPAKKAPNKMFDVALPPTVEAVKTHAQESPVNLEAIKAPRHLAELFGGKKPSCVVFFFDWDS